MDNCVSGLVLDVAPPCIELHYRIPVDMLLVHIVGLLVSMSRQQRPLEVLLLSIQYYFYSIHTIERSSFATSRQHPEEELFKNLSWATSPICHQQSSSDG